MVVVGGILQDVKEVSTSLVEQTYKVTLEINKNKTKYSIVSRKTLNENDWVTIGIPNFEVVNDHTYVSTILRNKNEVRPEIKKKQMQIEHSKHFFLYWRVDQYSEQKNKNF